MRTHESRMNAGQLLERSNHESGADEQDERQRDLHDDERIARPMALPARAGRASTAAEHAGDARAGVLEHRDGAEQQADGQRQHEREPQRGKVEGDLGKPRQVAGGERHQQAQRAVGQAEPDDAAEHAEGDAFEQQLAGDPPGSGAQRGANRQLLLPRFGPDEEQVGDVGAGNEEHQPNRAHQHPQDGAHVADEVVLERADARRDARLLEHLDAAARERREAGERHRHQPRGVGGRLGDRGAWFEPPQALVAELPEEHLAAIEPVWDDERNLAVEKAERLGQHTDDLAWLAVEHQHAADRRAVAAKLVPPVARGQHDCLRASRRIVRPGECPAEHRPDPEHRQDAIGDEQRARLFGLGKTRHAHRAGVPEADVLEHPAVLAVGEVQERRGAGPVDVDPWCGMIEGDELVGARVGQRLQEDALDDAEDRGIGADADGEGQGGHGGETGHSGEAPDDLPHSHVDSDGRLARKVRVILTPREARSSD